MENSVPGRLAGSEIHGFHTMEGQMTYKSLPNTPLLSHRCTGVPEKLQHFAERELAIGNIMEEAKARWLRPNEIYAILCNHKYFTIYVKPVNLPPGGTIVLFDRKMLRNFRKDGHNWKKKKDGKTVKEAHEHLKIGNEERIHVYYAHGQDNLTFVRRCYWLLDKRLDHIVLVHYRETQESQGSPITPVNSNSGSALSEPSASWLLSEESDSGVDRALYSSEKALLEPNNTIQNHEIRLHEINTLEWDDLVVPDDPNKLIAPEGGKFSGFEQRNRYEMNGYRSNCNTLSVHILPAENTSFGNLTDLVVGNNSEQINISDSVLFGTVDSQIDSTSQRNGSKPVNVGTGDSLDIINKDGLQNQDSFGKWMNYIMTDSPNPVLVDDPNLEYSISTGQESSRFMDHHKSILPEQIFSITDVSPASANSTEETKILVVGYFHEAHPPLAKSNLFCVCGDECVPAELVQSGVYRCFVSPHKPGLVDLYLSFDGQKPISQIVTFEYHYLTEKLMNLSEGKLKLEEFRYQMRLAHLLFSTSKRFSILSSKISQNALKEVKVFLRKTSQITESWASLIKSFEDNKLSFARAKDNLFELTLQNRLQEWLLERVVDDCKISDRDDQGQGVIHFCAILGYTWTVYPFSLSGLSLDYRDKFGWTALHWAAYYGRADMVATLLSAGAKPNLVTDPTSKLPGGCTAADLASKNGYDGLAAYLAEKGLVEHFKDMTIAGNVSGSLQIATSDSAYPGTFTEEEMYLKDTLAAYRTAADAAARIQAAFREHSLKLRTDAIQCSNPDDDARNIIAAMKIQHAFRNHERRKQILAAARIQHRFRTWKIRKDFLILRRQAIRIQAIFRGFQVRRQYRKIIFAVGVLEKAILRWRLKRKGFRGLKVCPGEDATCQDQKDDVEEDFFQASRKQAEERIERSVVRVQAMFRSKRAQEDYHRMKLAHNRATLEYEGLLNPDSDMG